MEESKLSPVASVREDAIKTTVSGPISRDDAALKRLGKKPVLKRSFGFITILGFSCTILITWEASLLLVYITNYSLTHYSMFGAYIAA
jgi:hypothetical protein